MMSRDNEELVWVAIQEIGLRHITAKKPDYWVTHAWGRARSRDGIDHRSIAKGQGSLHLAFVPKAPARP